MQYVSLAGTALGAYGSYQEGEYQKDYGRYTVAQTEQDIITKKAQIERQTGLAEAVAQEDIKRALQSGAEEEAAFREAAKITEGANMLAIARSGIIMKGSPLLVMNDIAKKAEQEELEMRYQTEVRASDIEYQKELNIQDIEYGAEVDYAGMRRGGQAALTAGEQAASAAKLRTTGTLLQGAGMFYDKKPKIKRRKPMMRKT